MNVLEPIVWSDGQKAEAKSAIMERAGPIIQYVVDVAIPFIREPFKGLLKDRLEDLPKSMDENYSQALAAMPSNYLDLLHLIILQYLEDYLYLQYLY